MQPSSLSTNTSTQPIPSDSLRDLHDAIIYMGLLRDELAALQERGFHPFTHSRRIKVQSITCRRQQHTFTVPQIHLYGDWLAMTGFDGPPYARIICLQDIIVICPEGECPTPAQRKKELVLKKHQARRKV